MGIFRDLTGQKFGFLSVVERAPNRGTGARWNCRCECGNEITCDSHSLTSGHARGCGCALARRKHGHTSRAGCSPTYSSWAAMIGRCTQPSSFAYAHYKARGITVCERWRVFENFLADMGERPNRNYTLERIDNDGNYEPGNCRWATRREQANNRSTNKLFEFRGEMLTYYEIARRVGMTPERLRHRLMRAGWSLEEAISPNTKQGKRPYVTMTDLAEGAVVEYRVFAERIRAGWSIERAKTTPNRLRKTI